MTSEVLDTIAYDALYKKSSQYIKRALRSENEGELGEFRLWASLSLEILGKAALSSHHPCLVIESNSLQSVLVAAGIGSDAAAKNNSIRIHDVRTIAGHEVYKRLKSVIPTFDSELEEICQSIASCRNAELHSAASPFDDEDARAWSGRYWHACNTILNHVNSSLNDWLSSAMATRAERKIEEAEEAVINFRVDQARENFQNISNRQRKKAIKEASSYDADSASENFTKRYEAVWETECPSCSSRSFLAGDETLDSFSDLLHRVFHEMDSPTHVDRIFEPIEFFCPACGLKFSSSLELRYAKMYQSHKVKFLVEPS